MPFTYSTDGGASFAKGSTGKGFKLPFPALGGNQRPCVHRLLSGNLVFVGTHLTMTQWVFSPWCSG